MNKLVLAFALLLAYPSFAQRNGSSTQRNGPMSWEVLFEIQDAQPGVIREAKINSRFFKRLEKTPNIWQRDMSQVRGGIGFEWTEEIHLNPAKNETIIFITTEPVEFERLVGLLTTKEEKDEFGKYKEGMGFTALEPKILGSGRSISPFSGGNRLVEVLSSRKGNIEEWIFQISRISQSTDTTPPLITILEPADIQSKSIGETILERTNVKIKVTDAGGIKSVLFDGITVALLADGTFTKMMTLPPATLQKQVTIQATDNNGNKSTTQFYVTKKLAPNVLTASDQAAIQDIAKGRYHALLISVQNYNPGIQPLANPHKDAENLAKVLTSRYRFNADDLIMLKDPTRAELGLVMENLREKLNKNDNLLIFFSGHGVYDKEIGQGYWLLRDAEFKNSGTYTSNTTIKDYLRSINSQHTLLVTDACFGGSITKSTDDFSEQVIYKLPSRVAITSGNLEKVPDKSVFMKYFLERLRDNDVKYLPARDLYASFYKAVIRNPGESGPQLPQYSNLINTGDQGGDFIFSLK